MKNKEKLINSIKSSPIKRLHEVRNYLKMVLSENNNLRSEEYWSAENQEKIALIKEIMSITDDEILDRMMDGNF